MPVRSMAEVKCNGVALTDPNTNLEDLADFEHASFVYDHYFGTEYGSDPPEV